MILLATVLRLSDGLPLSESTDNATDEHVVQAKKILKCLSPVLARSTSRICIQEDEFTIHATHNSSVGLAVAVGPTLPHLLAHGYLDAAQREWCRRHSASGVAAVRRPLAFTEFNNFLTQTAQKFRDPHAATTMFNVSAMRTELNERPLVYVTAEEVTRPRAAVARRLSSGDCRVDPGGVPLPDYSKVSSGVALRPLQHRHTAALTAAALLVLLDVYRALIVASSLHTEEDRSL